jgi:hypothetical protein
MNFRALVLCILKSVAQIGIIKNFEMPLTWFFPHKKEK